MKNTLKPDWLVNLLVRWAKQDLRRESGAMGYPSKCPGFSEKTTGGYSHTEPFAFEAEDFSDLVLCLDGLKDASLGQFVATMMHYKPWCIRELTAQGWPHGNSTHYARLHGAHAFLAAAMDHRKVLPKSDHQWSKVSQLG